MMRVRMMVFSLLHWRQTEATLVRSVSVLLHESAPPLRGEMKNPHFVADIDANEDLALGLLSLTAIVGNGPPYIECYQEDT